MTIKRNKLEAWLNVPAVFEGGYLSPYGKVQYGVREFDIHGFSRIIQTRRRGIPLQWLIEESHKNYTGYGSAMDNKAQKNRRYNNLPSDAINPNFWFVNVSGSGSMPIKLLTAHVTENSIYGIASNDNLAGSFDNMSGLFGPKLFLYTIRREK